MKLFKILDVELSFLRLYFSQFNTLYDRLPIIVIFIRSCTLILQYLSYPSVENKSKTEKQIRYY